MSAPPVPTAELELDVEAYYAHGGNKSRAAKARGLVRQTYIDRLKNAESAFGITLNRVVDGQVHATEMAKESLPKKGRIKRYILTSIQNNTHIHPGFANLLMYRDWLHDGELGDTCRLIVGTYSYNKAKYGDKAVKRGTDSVLDGDRLWYAPEVEPFIVDHALELAPGLAWCGEQNILPTARHPLTGFETYNGRLSNIIPHSKIRMESVASMADEATKFNYSTGTVTQRNYIQKRAGIIAEQQHDYGAVIVEVDSDGSWWVRQLYIDDEGAIMDTGPAGVNGVYITDEEVHLDDAVTAGIYWGDGHAAELEMWVRELAWGEGGMLDELRPQYQFIGDVFSMRTRGHHEIRDFHSRYEKHSEDEEIVENEVKLTADFVEETERPWCNTMIVQGNHDRHLDRWLNEADFRLDPANAKYFCLLQYHLLDAIDQGDEDFIILEWAMRRAGIPEDVRFLGRDETFIVAGVENGLHGDEGPNGSRGSTRALAKLGRPLNKGHDHVAAIRDTVFSAGACSLNFPYMTGPNSHSVSHIITYRNGKRAIVTMWANKWRA